MTDNLLIFIQMKYLYKKYQNTLELIVVFEVVAEARGGCRLTFFVIGIETVSSYTNT